MSVALFLEISDAGRNQCHHDAGVHVEVGENGFLCTWQGARASEGREGNKAGCGQPSSAVTVHLPAARAAQRECKQSEQMGK